MLIFSIYLCAKIRPRDAWGVLRVAPARDKSVNCNLLPSSSDKTAGLIGRAAPMAQKSRLSNGSLVALWLSAPDAAGAAGYPLEHRFLLKRWGSSADVCMPIMRKSRS